MAPIYILKLTDPEASLESVGGKGASLARLASSGLPVPDGFYVTTGAYRRWEEWITRVIQLPEKTAVQADGRIREWAWIAEESKFLRVILLEDGETVHNAFFDRSFKEKQG